LQHALTCQKIVFLYQLVEGAATSSFGTHVANLAGVPIEVVERADLVSKKFAEQFKAKMALKQERSASSKLSITAQADFAYLVKLATGALQQSDDAVKQKKTLAVLKATVARYIQTSA
jgi:DNA mismatch repair protein MSH6